MKTVVIFGGSGFIGKHIIRRIAKRGYKIIVPYQKQINEAKLRIYGSTGQIIPLKFVTIFDSIIQNQLKKATLIINLKTTWNEKKEPFTQSILNFNVNLTTIIKEHNKFCKFIYFSGIGIEEDSKSERSLAIFKSEKIISENIKNSIIIRPGIIIGGDDKFLKRLIPLFKFSFFIPLFGRGNTKFQPVFVDDISLAIDKISNSNFLGNHIFEFVGTEIFKYKNFYNLLISYLNIKRVFVPIPFTIVKFIVSIIEKTPFSPISSEQLNLFEKDNVASFKYKNLSHLSIEPQDIKEIIKKILIKR